MIKLGLKRGSTRAIFATAESILDFNFFNMAFKLDLHTHSIVSHDGGITDRQYVRILQKKLDFVAITDHNIISNNLPSQPGLAPKIIMGEEIRTTEGDIIGLYLETSVPAGLSLADAIQKIKQQNGLVYVPHPFEKSRRGLQIKQLQQFKKEFDIIEAFNARSLSSLYAELSTQFARTNNIAMASSSDAHGVLGVGTAYVKVQEAPTRENLVELLRQGELVCKYASPIAYLYPIINRTKRRFKRNND